MRPRGPGNEDGVALHNPRAILVPRALLTRGQRSATRGSGQNAKSISNWHLIGHNEGYCSNNVYILLPCFYGIRFWIWPEPLVARRVRRALGTRMPASRHEIAAILVTRPFNVKTAQTFRLWELMHGQIPLTGAS